MLDVQEVLPSVVCECYIYYIREVLLVTTKRNQKGECVEAKLNSLA